MPIVNIKTTKKCAFCKHWYDPTNSVIFPKHPKCNVWEIKDEGKKMCLKKNYNMPATAYCNQYECKLDLARK